MTRYRLAILTLVVFAATAFVFEAAAQFELPKWLPRIPVDKIPGLDKVPGLDKLLGKEAPITTSRRWAIGVTEDFGAGDCTRLPAPREPYWAQLPK